MGRGGRGETDPLILAIETSCDETSLALLRPPRTILKNLVYSQIELHRPYGGVVPELASRAHLERLPLLLSQLFSEGTPLDEITHVAVTRGPGLVNALLVGMGFAQGFAYARRLPFLGVNHLYGHILSPDLMEPMKTPALIFLATGGHTALYHLDSQLKSTPIKRTVDDAIGEAFDKVAKLLGLPYPGGPSIEGQAAQGDPHAFSLPQPRPQNPQALSFSGLKTAVVRLLKENQEKLSPTFVSDLCASFQRVIGETIHSTIAEALAKDQEIKAVYFVGGVARNEWIRSTLKKLEQEYGVPVHFPSLELCCDNAAMIARAAWERFRKGESDPWDLQPLSRWEVGEIQP